jgi:hypothetical protein
MCDKDNYKKEKRNNLIHLNKDVIISILEDRPARDDSCVNMLCGSFRFFYLAFLNLSGSSIST